MIRLGWRNSLLGGCLISLWCPCCFLQIFLQLFGIGCAGLNTFLVSYRPVFIALTVISLSYFFIRYRPSKWQFLTVVVLTSLLSFSPEILRLTNEKTSIPAVTSPDVVVTHWQIIGMHCESCRSAAERSLQKLPKVLSVNVELDSGQADVITRTTLDDQLIVDAVQSAGFQAYKIV